MGTGSKVASVFLRIIELCSAAVVAGFGGEYLHYVSNAHDHPNTRLVYTVALAGISIVVSLVCMIPADVLFYGFLLDAALFIMWMVSFGLLVGLTGTAGCNSSWYWSSWGYYWGGWYGRPIVVNQSLVGTAACGKWRATVALTFIGGWFWFISAILGAYVISRIHHDRREKRRNNGMFGDKNSMKQSKPATDPLGEAQDVNNGDRAVNPTSVV